MLSCWGYFDHTNGLELSHKIDVITYIHTAYFFIQSGTYESSLQIYCPLRPKLHVKSFKSYFTRRKVCQNDDSFEGSALRPHRIQESCECALTILNRTFSIHCIMYLFGKKLSRIIFEYLNKQTQVQ